MMKLKRLAVLMLVTGLLSSCVPVPSYPVDAYAGSLDKCLDIQGTYENFDSNSKKSLGMLTATFLPKRFDSGAYKGGFNFFEKTTSERFRAVPTWVTFHVVDTQRISVTAFNNRGQFFTEIIDMNEEDKNLRLEDSEKFSCSISSWQRSFTTTWSAEGNRRKWRRFNEVTKQADGSLKSFSKGDKWEGAFGLYFPDAGSGEVFHLYRRVDLTVDDIRANNEKAKKAIAQYDEVATSPPPAN